MCIGFRWLIDIRSGVLRRSLSLVGYLQLEAEWIVHAQLLVEVQIHYGRKTEHLRQIAKESTKLSCCTCHNCRCCGALQPTLQRDVGQHLNSYFANTDNDRWVMYGAIHLQISGNTTLYAKPLYYMRTRALTWLGQGAFSEVRCSSSRDVFLRRSVRSCTRCRWSRRDGRANSKSTNAFDYLQLLKGARNRVNFFPCCFARQAMCPLCLSRKIILRLIPILASVEVNLA